MDNRAMFHCSMCYFSSVSRRRLTYHYVTKHKHDDRLFITCNRGACGATFRNWGSYKKHVFRKHRENEDEEQDEFEPNHIEDGDEFLDEVMEEEEAQGENVPDMDPFEMLQWNAAKFVLYIRDRCKTSQKAMGKIIEGVQQLLAEYFDVIMRELRERSDPLTHTINVVAVADILRQEIPPAFIFSQVDTKTKQDDYMVTKLKMIMPEEVFLGKKYVWLKRPRVDLVEKEFKGFYLPILDSLKRLLINDQVRSCVDNPRPSAPIMRSILDGSYYKSHPFFSNNRNALALILYYDELEIVNPIGTKTHKLGMFYWTLANIYPEYRSTLHAINLLAIARYSDIASFGIDKILARFVHEVNALQNDGIEIAVNGVVKNYKGSLLIATADTPAAALLGGFKRSVSANKPCRHCLTSQGQWKVCTRESDFIMRNLQSHNEQAAVVTRETLTLGARRFWSIEYGVNCRSVLLDIEHFDVTKCLPQDIMHVLSEGILKDATKCFLKFLVRKNFITLPQLNEKIDLFEYGHLSKDKPAHVIADHLEEGLRQDSSQMVCLAHVLPFFISGHLVGEDGADDGEAHERLLCHIRLIQITNMCFSYTMTPDEAAFLNSEVEVFLCKFKALYPDTIVPKFHFLLHIGNQAKLFGPPRQSFCMRFEAAHEWYKSLMRVTRCFKNVPKTLSYRHESLRCLELAQNPLHRSVKFLYPGHDITSGLTEKVADTPLPHILFQHLTNEDFDTCEVMTSPKVTVHGTTFKNGTIILVNCEDEELPVFAKIKKIYIYENKILMLYTYIKTVSYFETLNAYHVDVNVELESNIINIEQLPFPHPLSLFSLHRQKFVVLFNHPRCEFVN